MTLSHPAPSPYAGDDLLSLAYQYNSSSSYIEALASDYEYSSPSPTP